MCMVVGLLLLLGRGCWPGLKTPIDTAIDNAFWFERSDTHTHTRIERGEFERCNCIRLQP